MSLEAHEKQQREAAAHKADESQQLADRAQEAKRAEDELARAKAKEDKAKADLDKEQKALQETEAASAKAQAELKIALANGTASKEMIAEAARLKAKVATQLDATNRAKDKLVAAESETKQKASESKKPSDKAGALDRLAKAEKRLARDLMSKEGKAKMDAEDAVREQERAKRKR